MTESDVQSKVLPVPRYQIGDVVFCARTGERKESLPCPDCLGIGKWTVTTPAGSTLEVACQRCSDRWTGGNISSLTYHVLAPYAQRLTIGSVQINTADYDKKPVKYMARETGIGSGSVYYEGQLFETEEAAIAAAQIDCDIHNAKQSQTAQRLHQERLHHLKFVNAHIDEAETASRSGWRSYRQLRSDIEDVISAAGGETSEGIIDRLADALRNDREYRDLPEVGQFLTATRDAIAAGDIGAVAKAFYALPEILRPEPAKATS